VLFADGKGYQITFRGARPVPPETLDRYQDSTLHNVFYILRQRLGEPELPSISGCGQDRQPIVDVVDISDADNRSVRVYLDRLTKLPVRQLYVRRDPKTRDRFEEVTIFAKYRDVGGGVQWPFDIQRFRNDEKIYEIYADTVQITRVSPRACSCCPRHRNPQAAEIAGPAGRVAPAVLRVPQRG